VIVPVDQKQKLLQNAEQKITAYPL